MFAGSSPLTRGTRIDSGQNDRFNRFIPAYAGNSCSNAPVSATIPVHPRLRGELSRSTTPPTVLLGSSPLTRGTQRREKPAICFDRFIPAYAGNSGTPQKLSALLFGSSPLTRGTQRREKPAICFDRFIPAYAGNSGTPQKLSALLFGSSPLTRGTPGANSSNV